MLTQEQQKLVEDNHNFIYHIIHQYDLCPEEYYDLLAICLCKAAKAFDPSAGYAFTTYAGRVMRNAVICSWRNNSSSTKIPKELLYSYNQERPGKHGNSTELIDLLDSPFCQQSLDVTAIEVEQFRDTLSELHRFVFDGLMEGRKERELAKDIGYTKAGISFIKQKLKQQWRDYCAA